MTQWAAVVVTYGPDLAVLQRQLDGLAGAAAIVVVDNASAEPQRADLLRLAQAGRFHLLAQDRNLGLAAGLNLGAAEALRRVPACDYLLFLDQDTEPGADGGRELVEAMARLRSEDPRAGLAGPLMVDAATGMSHGVHVVRGWRWARQWPQPGDVAALACASVNGSGMVVPVDAFRALGGFDEGLFIDHVDSEYSFRAAAAGHVLYTLPRLRFAHRMGERTLRIWLAGWRAWPYRSPARHFYLFRNAALLMRRPYVPGVWKAWALPKLALTALAHAIADPQRAAQLRAMGAGIAAGWRGESGVRAG